MYCRKSALIKTLISFEVAFCLTQESSEWRAQEKERLYRTGKSCFEEINILIKAILKFCTTNQLFKKCFMQTQQGLQFRKFKSRVSITIALKYLANRRVVW